MWMEFLRNILQNHRQLSLPMVMNVPGELWLLYSVATQLGLRSIVDSRTSTSVPEALSALAARDIKEVDLLEKLPMPEAEPVPVVRVCKEPSTYTLSVGPERLNTKWTRCHV